MAHEILSVKLCELDEKVGRLHSRVHLSETASPSQLRQEIAALERECAETKMSLENKLKFSRADVISTLAKAYAEIEQVLQRTAAEMKGHASAQEDAETVAEGKLLTAEYALDFAMLAADRALLLSMESVAAQRAQQENQKGSLQ